jgi:chitinase
MRNANLVIVASTVPNRQTFINSLISYLQKYGLDGVDIDWEYPAAADRGGSPEDTDNFVRLVSDIRDAFAEAGQPGWEVTITIPTSYWYLRGFDLANLQKYVSWFNLMSYDLVYPPRKNPAQLPMAWADKLLARDVGSAQQIHWPISRGYVLAFAILHSYAQMVPRCTSLAHDCVLHSPRRKKKAC